MQTSKLHAHKCPKCVQSNISTIWTHPTPPDDCSKEFHIRAHTCPVCGTEEYWKYVGKEKPTHPFTSWNDLPPISFAKGEYDTEEKAQKCLGNCATCQFQHLHFDGEDLGEAFEVFDIMIFI